MIRSRCYQLLLEPLQTWNGDKMPTRTRDLGDTTRWQGIQGHWGRTEPAPVCL